jgi:hypothetical protein
VWPRALFTTFPGTFMGQSVDSSSVLARYTFYGDANLDTAVNLADFNRLAANFGTGNDWVEGDFNYASQVNLADFNRQAAFFGSGPLADAGDGGGEGLLGGEPEYTYDELLVILMQMYPQYF